MQLTVLKVQRNADPCFPESKATSLNVLFCPKHKDIQLTMILEKSSESSYWRSVNQRMLLINVLKDESVIKIIADESSVK